MRKKPLALHGHIKEGLTPELWQEFQALLKLCPEQKRTVTRPDKTRRVYRWVEQLPYIDSEKGAWSLGAIVCEEISPTGETTTFAWLTNLSVNRNSVMAIADQFCRLRQKLEALRYYLLPQAFAAQAAQACHITLNTP